MSRAARRSKVLRSGAVGFVAGLATLGVVAHGSPAHGLVTSALGSAASAPEPHADGTRERSAAPTLPQAVPESQQQSQDPWLVPQDQSQNAPSQSADPQQQSVQPQYQQPQQPYAQPAPSQQPQSQAS